MLGCHRFIPIVCLHDGRDHVGAALSNAIRVGSHMITYRHDDSPLFPRPSNRLSL
jgi:hypothetical protein